MIKYWRNSSGKIPGLRKSESFTDYRRHSAGVNGSHGTLPNRQLQYQRLESYDESKLAQIRTKLFAYNSNYLLF
ncbi:CG13791 [Drosophila busckii]|uniref:CG13791 n=1 Tax=Drosophila busckii TaxID=30019 RepID=A0A0M3QT91_DROBS|nr:CG13791 [Drosophila busckii]